MGCCYYDDCRVSDFCISSNSGIRKFHKMYICILYNCFSYGDKAPKNALARFLTVVWMLFSYILLSLVAANTTSIVATQHLRKIENTVGLKVAIRIFNIWFGREN